MRERATSDLGPHGGGGGGGTALNKMILSHNEYSRNKALKEECL